MITNTLWGFLIIVVVSWAPKPYSSYEGPYKTQIPKREPSFSRLLTWIAEQSDGGSGFGFRV